MTHTWRIIFSAGLVVLMTCALWSTPLRAQGGLRFKPDSGAPLGAPGESSYLNGGYGSNSFLTPPSNISPSPAPTEEPVAPVAAESVSTADGLRAPPSVAPPAEVPANEANNAAMPYTTPRSPGGGLKLK